MNNQAEKVLTQLLQRAVDGVDKAVEFSQAQIPDVVEQLLLWHMVESLLWNIPAIILLFIAIFVWPAQFRKNGWARNRDGKIGEGEIPVTLVVSLALAFLSWLFSSTTWLQILIAPKLYLLEYAAELVK